jgi:Mn-dependent DtxR family transcriptional regulator
MQAVDQQKMITPPQALVHAEQFFDNGNLQPAPRREPWAAYLGMSRETLSRALTKLGKDELIAVEKTRIVILQPGELQDLARF